MSWNADDLKAIYKYIDGKQPITPAAEKLKVDFFAWFKTNVNFITEHLDSTVQQASNRRNAFNLANTKSLPELAAVRETISYGMSREEMQGKPRVADKAGNYPKRPGITVLSAQKGSIPKGGRATIRSGAKGDSVKAWQAILGISQTGVFDSTTVSATKSWQKAHNLKADGIVGTATWTAALGASASGENMPVEVAAITPVAPIGTSARDVAVGAMIPVQSITKSPVIGSAAKPPPKTVIASMSPPESTKSSFKTASMIPGVAMGTGIIDGFKKLPTWGKGMVLFAAAAIGYKGYEASRK